MIFNCLSPKLAQQGIKSFLSLIFFLLFAPLVLTACGGGGGGGSNTSTSGNTPAATLAKDVVTLDSTPTISSFTPDSEGGGSMILDVDGATVANWQGKIVVLPPSDNMPDGFIMRVIDVQETVSQEGKTNAAIQYSTPELDEVFDTIDYNPDNLYESAKIDRFYTPISFTEEVVENSVAAKSVTTSAAKNVKGKRQWLNGVDLTGKFKVFEDGKKGFSLNVDGLNIMEFKPDDGNVQHEQKISLGGGFEFYLNDLVAPISKSEGEPMKQELIIDYTTKENLKVTAEGSMEFSAAELAGKKFQCGVSGVDNKALKISGAKWRDNICVGGVSIGLAPMSFSFVAGNGSTKRVKVPVAVDIFFTMNTALKIEVNGFYKISRHSRNKRGVVIDLAQENDLNKFSIINEEYDVDVFEQTGNKVSSQFNSRIEGSISGEWSSQVGLAGALRFSNIYPLDVEAYGELETSGEISAGYSSIDSDPFASGGDYCFKIGIVPKLGYYLSAGLSAKLAKDINILGWKKKINIGGGYSFIHEGDIWKPEKKTEYDSCDGENYSVNFDVNNLVPYQVSISNLIVKEKSTGVVKNPEFLMWRIYNSQGVLIKEGANLSLLMSDINAVGNYIAEVFVRLRGADGGVKIRKKIPFSISGYAPRDLGLQVGDSNVTLNWTNESGISYKVCAREKNSVLNVLDIASACEVAESSSAFLRVHEVSGSPLRISSLTNGVLYEFVVIAEDGAGRRSATMPIIGIPQASTLTPPQNFKATPSNTQITLTWDAVLGATGYAYCTSQTQNSADCATYSASNPLWKDTADTSVVVTGLTNDIRSYFRVVAKGTSGMVSPVSEEVFASPNTNIATTSCGKPVKSILFQESFDSASIDMTKWDVDQTGGSALLVDGKLSVLSNTGSNRFPVIQTKSNPFPESGSFSFYCKAKYNTIGSNGSGACVAVQKMIENGNASLSYDSGSIFQLWADTALGGTDLLVNDTMYGGTPIFAKITPQDTDEHEYEICVIGSQVTGYRDGLKVGEGTLPANWSRPTKIWMGNPVLGNGGADWSTFDTDAVEVRQLEDGIDPNGWTLNPTTGHYYKALDNCGNWEQCETAARAVGAHLVVLDDQAENDWVANKFVTPVSTWGYWIGYTDKEQEGVWKTVTGKTVTGDVYTHWYPGNPDNYMGHQNYAVMHAGNQWNDTGLNDPGVPTYAVIERTTAPMGSNLLLGATVTDSGPSSSYYGNPNNITDGNIETARNLGTYSGSFNIFLSKPTTLAKLVLTPAMTPNGTVSYEIQTSTSSTGEAGTWTSHGLKNSVWEDHKALEIALNANTANVRMIKIIVHGSPSWVALFEAQGFAQ